MGIIDMFKRDKKPLTEEELKKMEEEEALESRRARLELSKKKREVKMKELEARRRRAEIDLYNLEIQKGNVESANILNALGFGDIGSGIYTLKRRGRKRNLMSTKIPPWF